MKKPAIRFHIIFLFLISFYANSQENTSQKDTIAKKIENYFFLDRENIHLQFNKKIFFTNEKATFKGYIYNIKKGLPFLTTTNIYATLYNEKGEKIDDKLFYANKGSFVGNFELNSGLPTGNYYVHVFTNWMKNFKEDESSTFKFKIIHQNDTSYNEEIADYSNVHIAFFPEGGTIVEGIKNNIGLTVTDCRGNILSISEGEIIDPKGKIIQKVHLNKFGHGKFELLADNKTHKVRFTINGNIIEGIIPVAKPLGISIEANSYAMKNKTSVKIKANAKTLELYKNKPLYLSINQFEKTSIFDVNFKNGQEEQTLIFSNEDLSVGVNSLRIIDSELNQIAERLVFKYPTERLEFNLTATKSSSDSLALSGQFNINNTNIGISILPEESMAIDDENDIYGSFFLKPYLNENPKETRYYFNEISTKKAYELDLLLLNQESGKYKWDDIKGLPPKNTFDFDCGLTLKGIVNQPLSNKSKFRIKIVSAKLGIVKFTTIDNKNEFYLSNLMITDSTFVNLSLIDHENMLTPFKGYPQILNSRRTFNKPFILKEKVCEAKIKIVNFEMPKFAIGTITLENVEIKMDAKPKLKRSKLLGNGNLRGYKITREEDHLDLMQFIRMNGFEVGNDPTMIQIYSRTTNSINGARSTPLVFIDDIQVMTLDMLMGMRMNEIDEIYLNPHAIVASIKNNMGIIKIYRKTGAEANFKSEAMSFLIKKAFAPSEPFKNTLYVSTSDIGFLNFGLVSWLPTLITRGTNTFKVEFPKMDQKTVKVLIEGFSADGKLISEIRTIDLP